MNIDNVLQDVLHSVRGELDEHLDAINQNTEELAAVYDCLGELDLKMEKLAERVDALQALLLAQTNTPKKDVRLSLKERDILQVLLNGPDRSSKEIARFLGLTPDLVAQTLYRMKQKGIPVLAQTLSGETAYTLPESFREEQLGI